MKTLVVFILSITFLGAYMITDKEKIIFDFKSTETSGKWKTINDVVMGGVSNSSFKILRNRTAVFSGSVSLENNGGFASVRTLAQNFDLDGYSGITIKINGDGKSYKFRLRTDDNFDGISYEANFKSSNDKWIEHKFLFEDFKPVFRGRKLMNVSELYPEEIKQLGFLISDQQDGQFALMIDWIKAYK